MCRGYIRNYDHLRCINLSLPMSNNDCIIFIGPLENDGGSGIKNQNIVRHLSRSIDVYPIDTSVWKQNRMMLLVRLFWTFLFHRQNRYIVSTSYKSAYRIFLMLNILGSLGNVFYWVIGGNLAENIVRDHLSKALYQKLHCIIVEGQSMKNNLARIGILNVKHCPNFKQIDFIPKSSPREDRCVRFLFLSRIHPEKGCNLIFDAVRRLNSEGLEESFIVDFYGGIFPDYERNFKESLERANNVAYKGFVDLMDFQNYKILSSYTAMLFPTYWKTEGFPGIIIDAFIAGVPVIASDWNMNSELIVDGQNGFLIPPSDSQALYQVMKSIILGKVDICKLKQNCQRQALRYDINEVLSEQNLREIGII